MSRDDDSERHRQSERLRQLEAKIAAAREKGRPPSHNESHYSQAQLAWRMVTELVAGLGIGLLIGLGLDTLLGTAPILMVVFIGFGLAAGIRVMMRTAEEVGRRGAGGGPDKSGAGPDGKGGPPGPDANDGPPGLGPGPGEDERGD